MPVRIRDSKGNPYIKIKALTCSQEVPNGGSQYITAVFPKKYVT